MVGLLSLPTEVLVEILAFLSPSSLCRVSLACHRLRDVVRTEPVWVARAWQETGLRFRSAPEYSPRQFYQCCLHRLGPLLGLWQRTERGYTPHGGLLRLIHRDNSIVAELVKPGRSAQDPVLVPLTVPVVVVRAGRTGNRPEVEHLDQALYQLGEVPILDPRLGDVENKLVVKYHALHRRRDPQGCPLAPGLFIGGYGDYCEHNDFGWESLAMRQFIHLQLGGQAGPYLRGVHITGYSSVPAGQVIFEVSNHRCLVLRGQQKETCKSIEECQQFVEHEENRVEHFVLPRDCNTGRNAETKAFLEQQKTCQGRWAAKAQLVSKNITNPHMTSANFILFNNDIFAVIFLKPRFITLFKRAFDV